MAGDVGDAATFAFMFTDIEGSTRSWEDDADAMRAALAVHDEVVRTAIAAHGGEVFATGGDGFAAAFPTAAHAAGAAIDAALALARCAWPGPTRLRMRVGVHVGAAQRRDDNYFGPALNRCARLMASGHGGQVLVSEAAATLLADALPSGTRLIDLGQHRLRDLTRAERVFQLQHADLDHDFPPLRSLDVARTNLPVQSTTLFGRDDDLSRVLAAAGNGALVTLTGVGGVGKTRLALQAAAELLPHTRDGVFLVEFGAVVDAAVVAEVVASALSLQLSGGQVPVDAIIAHLESRRLLLVLDNCEHLLDAVAAFVQAIMRVCADVSVLATSREGLGLPGEHIVAVGSLALPADGDPREVQLAAPSMQLLVDRARLVRPDFSPTAETVGALAQVCRRLDGIPLALELAAARLRSMTPSEIASRLDSRFRLLTGGGRGAANRHQTLRGTIDWSYDLLDAEERFVLERASVFAGGFDLAAAESVCSGDDVDGLDVIDYLGRLVDKSLLVADEVEATTRYRMLETVRDYALERLDGRAEVTDVRRRHADHYARFASDAGVGLRGREERAWIERTERELENLRVAVLWSVESGHAEIACDIVGALALEMNRLDHAIGSWAELLAEGPEVTTNPHWPRVLAFAAFSAVQHRDHERARTWRDAARRAAAVEGTVPVVVVRVYDSDMIVTLSIDGPEAYVRVGEERLAAARACGDAYELGRALASLAGGLALTGGDGHALANEALEIAAVTDNPTVRCSACLTLAQATLPGDQAAGLALLDDAEEAARAAGNDSLILIINHLRANALVTAADPVAALPALLAAVDAEMRRGYHQSLTGSIRLVVSVLAMVGDDEAAATLYGYTSSVFAEGTRSWKPAQEGDAVSALPERLGAARYDELMRRGAQLDPEAAVAFARAAATSRLEGAPHS